MQEKIKASFPKNIPLNMENAVTIYMDNNFCMVEVQ